MHRSTIEDCELLTLPKFDAISGSITSINGEQEIPFEIQRIYYLYDIPAAEERGGHAHKELVQLVVAASGSFDFVVDDGTTKKRFFLSQPNVGLLLPSGLWRTLENFSSGAICLVLASETYSEADYIRNYNEFLKLKSDGKI